MAISTNSELWHPENSGGRRFAVAIGVSFVIEVLALGALLPWMSHQAPNPSDHPSPIKLSIIAPSPPKPPAPKVTPKPVVPPPPVPVTPPMPLLPPPLARPSVHRVAHRPPLPRHVVQPPVVQPPVVQPPVQQTPPPPAPPVPTAGELDVFQAAMRRAVQARATGIEPGAAVMAHEAGVAQIEFTYFNGVVSDVRIVASSGYPLLDAAAVEAARTANYPQAPADFTGSPHTVVVGIIFQAAATSVDSD